MKPRLIILLGVAVVLVVLLAMKFSSPEPSETEAEDIVSLEGDDLEAIRLTQTALSQRPLPGEAPEEEPELDIRVEVNTSGGKNRLDYYISEAHGFYVETFRIEFRYKGSPLRFAHYLESYVKANETLKDCIEVVPAELSKVGGDIGTSENWEAEIISYGRARAENPDPLPPVANIRRCD